MEEDLWELPPNEWFFSRRPPGVVFHIGVVLLACGLLWARSTPGGDSLLSFTIVFGILVAVVVWFVRLITFGDARRNQCSAGSRRTFLIAPACGFVALALILAGVPVRVRWEASRPAFEDALERVAVDEDGMIRRGQRLGFFEVELIVEDQDSVLFYTPGPLLDSAGFAYVPNGRFPKPAEGTYFRHLRGPWYSWTAGF